MNGLIFFTSDSSNIAYASVIEGQHSPVTVNGGTLNAVSNNTIGYSYAYGISIVGDLILKNTNINIRSNSQSNNSYAYGTSSVDSLKIYDSNINVTSTSGIGQGYTWGLSNVGAIEFYGGKIRTKGSDDEKTNLFYNPPTIVVPDGKQTYEGVGEDGYKEFYLIDSN